VAALGPFHRVETRFQTKEIARLLQLSGEIWGRTAKWSFGPSVKAYPAALRGGRRGIEFSTNTAPYPDGSAPNEIRWYLNLTPGVQLRKESGEDFACILADVNNMQP
jgi:hypothetical protein